MTGKNNEYDVGYMVKNQEMFAKLSIKLYKHEGILKYAWKSFGIYIKFNSKYTYNQLEKMGLKLQFYKKLGKYVWGLLLVDKNQLVPELKRLQRMGFRVERNMNNNGMGRLIADLI